MSTLLDFLRRNHPAFRDARLPSLYSDFRSQQSSNPEGYAANIEAWESGIAAAARAGVLTSGGSDRYIVDAGPALTKELESRAYGRPLAFEAVVAEAQRKSSMIPLSDYLHGPANLYERALSIRPWDVLQWGLHQLGLPYRKSSTGERLVLVGNVQEAGGLLRKSFDADSRELDRILPLETFAQRAGKTLDVSHPLTSDDLRVLLVHMSRDLHFLAFDKAVVKIKGSSDKTNQLTEQDRNIASVKSSIAELTVQIQSLTAKSSALMQTARTEMKDNNRTAAARALRSRKVVEELLDQRSQLLDQLERAFSKIEQAADQVSFVQAMKVSRDALHNLNSQVGDIERVEDVLSDLQTEMDHVNDVEQIMTEAGQSSQAIDEDEIDQELAALEKDTQKHHAATESNAKLVEPTTQLEDLKRIQAPKHTPGEAVDRENVESTDADMEASIEGLRGLALKEDEARSHQEPEQQLEGTLS